MARKEAVNSQRDGKLRVFSITSGKGGVGKTLLSVNLACALRDLGKEILIIDGNFGNGNVDLLFGVSPEKTIFDVLRGVNSLKEVLVNALPGIHIIPAGSGIYEISAPESHHKLSLLSELDTIDDLAEIVIVDTPPGITPNVMFFNTSATDIVFVTTPEITSVVNTISSINVLNSKFGEKEFKLIVNMAENEYDAESTFNMIEAEVERLYDVRLINCGYCPFDGKLKVATSLLATHPEKSSNGRLFERFNQIAKNLIENVPGKKSRKGHQFFARRILQEKHDEAITQSLK
jgi:flagellar biosynthesis protein FlhG